MLQNYIKIIGLFIFCCFTFIACEEEYEINTDDFESKLVVNSLFTFDRPWIVNVSSSHNILDHSTNVEYLENAKVEVYNAFGEFLYTLDHVGEGNYSKNDYSPSATRGYQIKVSSTGFKPVTAKSYVTERADLEINNFKEVRSEDQTGVEVNFSIKDNSNVEAYYMWEIVELNEDGENANASASITKTWIDNIIENPQSIDSDIEDLINKNIFGNGSYETIFNSLEDGFNKLNGEITVSDINRGNTQGGKSPTIIKGGGTSDGGEIITVTGVNISESDIQALGGGDEEANGEGEVEVDKYELRVMSISKELFDYYVSVQSYLDYSGNNSVQDPYNIYSNINNGLGVFAGYSETFIRF